MGKQKKSKNTGSIIAMVLSPIVVVVIFYSNYLNRIDANNFWSGVFSNVGTEMAGIILTVGIIERVINKKRQDSHTEALAEARLRMKSVLSHVINEYTRFENVKEYEHNANVIYRFQISLMKLNNALNRLIVLIDEHDPELATTIDSYIYFIDDILIISNLFNHQRTNEYNNEKIKLVKESFEKFRAIYEPHLETIWK